MVIWKTFLMENVLDTHHSNADKLQALISRDQNVSKLLITQTDFHRKKTVSARKWKLLSS